MQFWIEFGLLDFVCAQGTHAGWVAVTRCSVRTHTELLITEQPFFSELQSIRTFCTNTARWLFCVNLCGVLHGIFDVTKWDHWHKRNTCYGTDNTIWSEFRQVAKCIGVFYGIDFGFSWSSISNTRKVLERTRNHRIILSVGKRCGMSLNQSTTCKSYKFAWLKGKFWKEWKKNTVWNKFIRLKRIFWMK